MESVRCDAKAFAVAEESIGNDEEFRTYSHRPVTGSVADDAKRSLLIVAPARQTAKLSRLRRAG